MEKPPPLEGLRIAILVEDGFEQIEMTAPREALEAAGARTFIVSPRDEKVQGFNHDDPADCFAVDVALSDASPMDFDALLLPGGVRNPDALRTNNTASLFVHAFDVAKRPIAAICHGPWMLVESGLARGKTMTSWPSLKTDITNAGGRWVDKEVVTDGLLVTSRQPDDIPAFNRAMIKLFAKAPAAPGPSVVRR